MSTTHDGDNHLKAIDKLFCLEYTYNYIYINIHETTMLDLSTENICMTPSVYFCFQHS
jgi:hypothetical protein